MNKGGHTVLVVLSALGVSAAVQAQTAVTVFGVVDTAWNYVSAGDEIGLPHNF
jgi:predicted porin